MITFLPPFLFIAAAYALARASSMADAARKLVTASDRLTTVDETAILGAQRVGRAVRRELDALNAGLDGAFGRMRALETALEDRVAQLEDAGARAGVKAETIAQRLHEERTGIEALVAALGEATTRSAQTFSARQRFEMTIDSAGEQLKGSASNAGEALASRTAQLNAAIEASADDLKGAASHASESLALRTTQLKAMIEAAAGEVKDATARSSEVFGAARRPVAQHD